MQRISYKDIGLKYTLSPYDKPVASVKPGETIILETQDACSGQIRTENDFRDHSKIPFGNPLVGPIYVEGAEKGNTIAVSIADIKPTTGQGCIYLADYAGAYLPPTTLRFINARFPRRTKVCKIRDGSVFFSEKITLPYRPMIGTIGVAPFPESESTSAGVLPGRHGGNMDIPDVAPGSTIFLPVFHKGAFLYAGDAHAIQGESEISGNGVEMPAEIKLKIDLLKETTALPRIETADEVMFVAATSAGRSFEEAMRMAFFELTLWMEEKHGIDRFDGLMLCSQVGKVRVGNLWTVAARIEKKYLV